MSTEDTKQENPDKHTSSQYFRFNSWLKVSVNVKQGNVRKTMEDRTLVSNFHYQHKDYYILLICDGHGGGEVADMIVANFTKTFQKQLIAHKKIRKVLDATFVSLHGQAKTLHLESGSTVSLILVINKMMSNQHEIGVLPINRQKTQVWSANVGDSSAYGICEKQDQKIMIRKLTTDHNLDHKSERLRLEQLKDDYRFQDGYVVAKDGSAINMSRAIGDLTFEGAILPNPTIKKLSTPYSIIMLSSDGIWDVVNPKELWARLCPKKELKAWRYSAERLNEWRNTTFPQHDNTSLMIIYMKHGSADKMKQQE